KVRDSDVAAAASLGAIRRGLLSLSACMRPPFIVGGIANKCEIRINGAEVNRRIAHIIDFCYEMPERAFVYGYTKRTGRSRRQGDGRSHRNGNSDRQVSSRSRFAYAGSARARQYAYDLSGRSQPH